MIQNLSEKLDRPIVLVGMMGAGKTHIGKALARVLALDFIDSDEVIEAKAGCNISDIFARDGESRFRVVEAATVQELLERGPCVISTGGGAVMNPQSLNFIVGKSISVWVQASLEDMLARVSKNRNRPLLKAENPAQVLLDLLEKRKDLYAKALIHVENHNGESQRAVEQILDGVARALKIQQSDV